MPNPAKPLERKRLEGNPGHQKLGQPLMILPTTSQIPEAPKALGRVGKQEWARIWSFAGPWIAQTDVYILTMFCQGCDDRESLRKVLKRDGLFAEGSMGQKVSHPAVAQLRTLERQMTGWLSLCGFTPSDRSRLGLAEVQRESKLEEFLSKRAQRA